jgi:hypothetical protein
MEQLWIVLSDSGHTEDDLMSSDEPLYSVIEFILNRATSDQLEVIAEAVKRRQKPGKGLGGFSPRSMAENMAEKVKQQLGGMLDVQAISRQIVSDLIRQKEPNISDDELEVLLKNWLPGSTRTDVEQTAEQEKISPDLLITMVSQYVSARQGTLSQQEQAQLPENWQSRYWESFPEHIRAQIRAHLSGQLNEVDFWDSVISSLNR